MLRREMNPSHRLIDDGDIPLIGLLHQKSWASPLYLLPPKPCVSAAMSTVAEGADLHQQAHSVAIAYPSPPLLVAKNHIVSLHQLLHPPLAGGSCSPPVFLTIAVLIMPESLRWLVLQGWVAEAHKVLERTLNSPEGVELWLAEIREAAGIGILPRGSFVSSGNVTMTLLHKLLETGEGTWTIVLDAAVGLQFFNRQ